MPELPEVETVVRQLDRLVRGKRLQQLLINDPLLGGLPTEVVRRRSVRGVERVGKQVVFELAAAGSGKSERGMVWLAVHLRMTGRLIWAPIQGDKNDRSARRVRAQLVFREGTIDFLDTRRFGTMLLTDQRETLEPAGVDPTTIAFTPELMRQLLRRSDQAIKVWLLRQDRLVGLGNIYACEALHRARISPWRRTRRLTSAEALRLYQAIRRVLDRAITHCGTTFSDFQDVQGSTGSYQKYLEVYAREAEPCLNCRGVVERLTQQGRGTFFCRRCQPGRIIDR